jgi:hypothetical protein
MSPTMVTSRFSGLRNAPVSKEACRGKRDLLRIKSALRYIGIPERRLERLRSMIKADEFNCCWFHLQDKSSKVSALVFFLCKASTYTLVCTLEHIPKSPEHIPKSPVQDLSCTGLLGMCSSVAGSICRKRIGKFSSQSPGTFAI